MQTVAVQMNVPKECKEIVDAVSLIVAEVMAKKGVSELAGAALPALIKAVDGFGDVGAEIKSEHKAELAAYLVAEVMKALKI